MGGYFKLIENQLDKKLEIVLYCNLRRSNPRPYAKRDEKGKGILVVRFHMRGDSFAKPLSSFAGESSRPFFMNTLFGNDYQERKNFISLLKEKAPTVHQAYVNKKLYKLRGALTTINYNMDAETKKENPNEAELLKLKEEKIRLEREIEIYLG